MTFSSLISGTIPNHGKYNSRPGKVTRVIQHHWGGVAGGIERLSNPTQKASATYLVLSDGRILGQVPEEFRPWTSGGATADNPSITIECQNSTGAPDYKVSDAAVNAIEHLLADVAARHGFGSLTPTNYRGHREFAATACPGPYLWPRLQSIRDAANALRGSTILVGSHGGVPVPVHIPAPPAIPAPPPAQEDDMPLNAADATLINNLVINVLRGAEFKQIVKQIVKDTVPTPPTAAVLAAAVTDHLLVTKPEAGLTVWQTLRDTRVIARRVEDAWRKFVNLPPV